MEKTIKRTPKGPYIMFKSLKTNTNRMKNEERCRSRSRSQFGRTSALFFSPFFFFYLISLNSFNIWRLDLGPFPSIPSRLFIGNAGTWLIWSSPKWAVASTWSNLARPGELVTSPLSYLGPQASQRLAWVSQGSKKASKWPFAPPPFWVFSTFFWVFTSPRWAGYFHMLLFID